MGSPEEKPSNEVAVTKVTEVVIVRKKPNRFVVLFQVLVGIVTSSIVSIMLVLPFWMQVLPMLAQNGSRDLGIGLVPQTGHLQPGIYTITNVKFLSLATIKNANDEEPIHGGHDPLKGIHWELIELPNRQYRLRSLFYESFASYRSARARFGEGIIGSEFMASWIIDDFDNQGTYTISPSTGHYWSLESGDKGSEIILSDNARDPRSQWYFSKATSLQYAVYYIPAYGPGLVNRITTAIAYAFTAAVEIAVKALAEEARKQAEASQSNLTAAHPTESASN